MPIDSNFRERWCDGDETSSLVVFRTESLIDVAVPDDAKAFLSSAGLPESAAPFLSFAAPTTGSLQTAAAAWQLSPDYKQYHIIGSNGSGDPLCIDETRNGQIIYLNHDLNFRRILINSSVTQLAESLLAFRHVVRETQRRNGDDAFLDGDVPRDLQQWLLSELTRIDLPATHVDYFWSQTMDDIRTSAT